MMRRFFTLFIPLALFGGLLVSDRPFPDFLPGLTGSELGLVESLQAILLFLAFCVALRLLSRCREFPNWIRGWIAAGAMGALYVFLEEISYGQHYLNWSAPEYWRTINDQNETNLHNTSSWLDQKPRLLLEIGIILGGIVVPLLRKHKPQALKRWFAPILPDSALFVIALLAIVPRVYERVIDLVGMYHLHLFNRTSEIQELYFYYFALAYLIFLYQQLRIHLPIVYVPDS